MFFYLWKTNENTTDSRGDTHRGILFFTDTNLAEDPYFILIVPVRGETRTQAEPFFFIHIIKGDTLSLLKHRAFLPFQLLLLGYQ